MHTYHLFGLVLGLGLAAAASAAIESVTPARLSPGTRVSIDGEAFSSRPSAWLELDGRRIRLRVDRRGASDTHLTATLKSVPRGLHGDCLLRVKPKGARTGFTFSGASIELPDATEITPPLGGAGTVVTIVGDYFGTKKGRVAFGTRPAKVTSWTDTEIRALVPEGVEPGLVFVQVTNKAGTDASALVFDSRP